MSYFPRLTRTIGLARMAGFGLALICTSIVGIMLGTCAAAVFP